MQTDCLCLKIDGTKLLVVKELTAPEDGDPLLHEGRAYTVRHVVKDRPTASSRLVIATENPLAT